ncbi:oligosaccharide flippase family protein [Anoxynatronum buryatiense]|uniref:Membrane protein involved in the export of O-antigen and teichoic acid n=1 Tax=Anoxynatronum buryatiense TaxID=489973 RepID=A0AA46AIW6_9CLOT|nr:oligosaccharide flippase family protein [Anoxynatronum buryatiense]SMP54851.1 Membrane protein involved in the export of O-antigen and teichoic acid [Anoxynatronum buryatiense]
MEQSLRRDALSSYTNLFINILAALILVPIVESHVGKSHYGIYQFVISLTIYSELMSMGLGKTIERYVAKYAEEKKEEMEGAIVSIVLTLYIGTGLVFLGGVAVLYHYFGHIFAFTGTELTLAKTSFLIAAANAGLNIPASLFQSHLRGRGRFSLLFNIGTVKALLKLLTVTTVLRLGGGIVAVFLVEMILVQSANLLFALVSVFRYHLKIRLFHLDKALFHKLFQYTTFVFLSGVAHTLYWNTDNIVLGMFTNAEVIAEYALSQRLIDYFYRYSIAFSGLFLPKFMAHYVVKDLAESKARASSLFTRSSRVLAILMSFAVVNFLVLGRDFVVLWIGHRYPMTYVYAITILIPYWLILAQSTGVELLYVMKRHRISTYIYLGSAIVNIVATVYLVQRIGPMGAALATATTLFLGSFVMTNFYYRKLLQLDLMHHFRVVFLKNGVVSGIALAFGYGLNRLLDGTVLTGFLTKGMLLNLLFLPLIFWVLLTPEERLSILRRLGMGKPVKKEAP